jgi:hypothetical protein
LVSGAAGKHSGTHISLTIDVGDILLLKKKKDKNIKSYQLF